MPVYLPSSTTVGVAGGLQSMAAPEAVGNVGSLVLLAFPAASRTSTTTVLLPFPSDSSQHFACWQPSHPVNSRFSFAKRQLPTPASVSLNETARVTERLKVRSEER